MRVPRPNDSAAEKDAAPAKADATVPTTFLPAVIELEDGTKVQRTPDETVEQNTLDGGYSYFLQSEETIAEAPYNTTFLHANERGCNSCHETWPARSTTCSGAMSI